MCIRDRYPRDRERERERGRERERDCIIESMLQLFFSVTMIDITNGCYTLDTESARKKCMSNSNLGN